jgi:hypothetical protein
MVLNLYVCNFDHEIARFWLARINEILPSDLQSLAQFLMRIFFSTFGTYLQDLDQADLSLYSLLGFPDQNSRAWESLVTYQGASVFLIR